MPPILDHDRSLRRRAGAFTVVELLVAVAIVIVLAALAFALVRRSRSAAERATCVNRLRQAATVLIGGAGDRGGRIELFRGGNGSFEYRPYFVVRDELGLPASPYDAHFATLREVMFCPAAPEPKLPHWHCYGVNFTDSERAGVAWRDDKVRDSAGRSSTVSTLQLATAAGPSNYVLVADSCMADGQQAFRIRGDDRIALRHGGRANAVFLDGSARSLKLGDLGGLGFDDAFDTAVNPPTVVAVPRD